MCPPEPPREPAPRPTHRASAGTHPQPKLSPLAPELALLLAPESRQKKKNSSLQSPLFLAFSKNLFKEALREEDIFLNLLSGAGSTTALGCHLSDTALRRDP